MGCITDWTAPELWSTYIQLTEAEAAFRIHKTELSHRPTWHQRAARVQAHILVCFLPYVAVEGPGAVEMRAGLGNSPRTILDELACIQSTDVILPTATTPKRELGLLLTTRWVTKVFLV